MDCPRCKMPLSKDKYEGVEVDYCQNCWGYWLDKGEFKAICDTKEYVFSDDEKSKIKETLKGKADIESEVTLNCPKCDKVMEKLTSNVKSPIILDWCPDHGVWLDTGELKKVQILAEEKENLKKLYFKKIMKRSRE